MTSKLHPDERKAQILAAALVIAAKSGYQNVQRKALAEKCGVAESLVNRYFKTMPELKRDVMRAAVREKCLAVIAQGLAMHDRQALKAPEALRKAAAASLKP